MPRSPLLRPSRALPRNAASHAARGATLRRWPATSAAASALACMTALFPAGAQAAEVGAPYLVLSAGASKIKGACGSTTPCDTTGNGFKVLLGTRSPANVALEGGYWNFGKATVGTQSAKVDGFGLAVALHDDFHPEWTAAGRLGLASLKGSGGGLSGSNTTLVYGFSLGYRITPQLTLEGAIDAARPKFDGTRTSVQLLGAHVSITF